MSPSSQSRPDDRPLHWSNYAAHGFVMLAMAASFLVTGDGLVGFAIGIVFAIVFSAAQPVLLGSTLTANRFLRLAMPLAGTSIVTGGLLKLLLRIVTSSLA